MNIFNEIDDVPFKNLITSLHLDHNITATLIETCNEIQYIHFTGSYSTGLKFKQFNLANKLINIGVELGGKDAAYIRADIKKEQLKSIIINILDGAFYNGNHVVV